ncbi:hypothetical protein CSQ96_20900 [Janthinobacterium sp. BJB412]|nr:hypothetical protein CSQ96_20900 [Janthinobacterium sp. BJB412]
MLNGSAGVLGQQGILGNAVHGNSKEAAYLNIANGNLVLQDSDDFLAAHGVNVALTRTYNSQGALNDGNGANWKYGLVKQVNGLVGTVNTAGSKVYRTAGDGSVALFSYNAAKAAYLSNDGAGAYQSMTFNSAANEWTWRGDRNDLLGTYEVYDGANNGRVVRAGDAVGIRQKYAYNAAGQLAQVTDAVGKADAAVLAGDAANGANDQTYFDYDAAGNLSQIRHVLAGTDANPLRSMVRTHYSYDALHRLRSVSVDLSSVSYDQNGAVQLSAANSNTDDGNVYTTTYTYDGDSNRVTGLLQSDGSALAFTYKQVGADWKVDSVTDALGRKTNIDYSVPNRTTVTDPLGLKTTYGFDAAGQLKDISGPVVNGAIQLTTFNYDAVGNLLSVVDARNLATVYGYDANGNRNYERDPAGNTISRNFDLTSNRLLAEARYIQPDPDGAGAGVPSDASRTAYTYDANGRVHYVFSPDLGVTEYRYTANGELATELRYKDKLWPSRGWTDLASPAESQVTPAVLAGYFDNTKAARTDYTYDARGLMRTATRYANTNAAGVGLLDGLQSVTSYTYDQAGRLLYSKDGNGNLSSNVYDGMGRLLSQTNAQGTVVKSVYDARSNLSVTTTVAGTGAAISSVSYVRDNAGQLIAVQQAFAATPAMGTTLNAYDDNGRLRMVTGPSGQRTYWLFDEAGRQVAQIEHSGALTEYVYNANNQIVKTTRYANVVDTAGLVDAQGKPSAVTLATLRPKANPGTDRSSWNGYDNAGRLVASVDANGFVTRMTYDGNSRLTSTVYRTRPLDTSRLDLGIPLSSQGEATPEDDNADYVYYDHSGRVVGKMNAIGFLTEYRYDAGGLQVETITYERYTAPSTRRSNDINVLRPALAPGLDIHQRFIYNGRNQLVGSIDGDNYLTETSYDAAGNVAARRRYAKAVTKPAGATLADLGITIHADDRVTRYSYTALNQLERESTLEGNFTRYQYDAAGNVVSLTRGSAGAAEATSASRYDGAGRLIASLNDEGVAKLAALGANPDAGAVAGLWALYAQHNNYDGGGLLASTVDAQGNRTLYYYDAMGRRSHTVNALGEVQEQRYDSFDQVVKTIQYAKRIDAATLAGLLGGRADAAAGTALAALSTVANQSVFYYDNNGRLSYSIDGAGGVKSTTYNTFGKVKVAVVYAGQLNEAVLGALSGGKLGNQRGGANDAAAKALDAILNSTVGNQRSVIYYNSASQLIYTVNAMGEVLRHTYYFSDWPHLETLTRYAKRLAPDALQGDAAEMLGFAAANAGNAGNTVQLLNYNMRRQVTDVSDAITGGNHTATVFNAFGEVEKVTQYATAASTAANVNLDLVVQTIFDHDGRVRASIDGAGGVTAFRYDGAGHVVDKVSYANRLRLYATSTNISKTFDDAMALAELSDPARDIHQRFVYVNGRLSATLTSQQATAVRNAQGQITSYTSKWAVSKQSYDANGRPAASTGYAATMEVAGAAPSDESVRLWMAAADGRADAEPGGDASVRLLRDALGRVIATATAQRAANNGVEWAVVRQDYDAAGNVAVRTAYATAFKSPEPSAAEVAAAASPYDAVTIYNYDGANRVVMSAAAQGPSADQPAVQQWAVARLVYDSAGNVVKRTQFGPLLRMNPPLLDQNGAAVNLAGKVVDNDLVDRNTRILYDAANRPVVTVDANGGISKQVYDAKGNVVQSVVYGKPTSAPALVAADYNPALTAADHVTRTVFDANNRPVYVVDPLGLATEYRYDVLGNVAAKVRYATPLSDANLAALAKLASTAGPAELKPLLPKAGAGDQTERYAYDQEHRLRYTVDANGGLKETRYNALGQVAATLEYAKPKTFVDPLTLAALDDEALAQSNGARLNSFLYDAAGRLRASIDATNAVTAFQYDVNGNLVDKIAYAGFLNPLQTFDAALAAGSLGDPLRDTHQRFVYDAAGNLVATLTAQSTTSRRDSPDSVSYAVKWAVSKQTRDQFGRVTARTGYACLMDSASRTPAAADVLQWIAAADARTVNDPANPGSQGVVSDATVRMVYDAAGRLAATATAQRRGANGSIEWSLVRQDYDAVGNLLARTAYANTLIAADPSAAQILNGVAASASDAVTRYNYDDMNRVVVTATAQGPANDDDPTQRWALTRLSYDAYGNVVNRRQFGTLLRSNTPPADLGTAVAENDALDRLTRTIYDADNRPVVSIDAAGAISRVVYDARGNAVQRIAYATPTTAPALITAAYGLPPGVDDRVSRTVYDLEDRPVYAIDALDRLTQRRYDALGNVTTTIRYNNALAAELLAKITPQSTADDAKALLPQATAQDRVERYTYDQERRLRYTVDAAGYVKENVYNPLGQLSETREYLVPPTLSFADQLLTSEVYNASFGQVEQGSVNVNWFGYDAAGHLSVSTDSQQASERYVYDGLGRKTAFTNKADRTWTYEYDAAGRLTLETSPRVAVYSYSPLTQMGGWGAGQQLAMMTRLEYDALGNLSRRTEGAGSTAPRVTEYRYDALGRQTKTILPSTLVYDAASDPKSSVGAAAAVEKNSGPRVIRVTYNAFGDAVSNTDVGGKTSYKVYDKHGQVRFDVDAMGFVTGYLRDNFGNVTELTRYADSKGLSAAQIPAQVADNAFANALGASPDDRTVASRYDKLDRVVKVIEPTTSIFDQHSIGAASELNAAKTTDTRYTGFGEVAREDVYGAGGDGARLTDAASTRYGYDARGNKTSQFAVLTAAADGKSGTGYLTTYAYAYDPDSKGSKVTRTEFAGTYAWKDGVAEKLQTAASAPDRSTASVYDKQKRLISETKLNASFFESGIAQRNRNLTTSYGYDQLGRQTSTTDALGSTTFTYYDALGRTVAVAKTQAPGFADITPAGAPLTEFKLDMLGNTVLRVEYAQDLTGNVNAAGYTAPTGAMAGDANNRVTATRYDTSGHAVATLDAEQFTKGATASPINTSYDIYGRVAKQWRSVTSVTGSQPGAPSVTQTAFQINSYDDLGRLLEVETPGNENLVDKSATPPPSTVKHNDYNAFGEITATTVRSGSKPAETVSYAKYDRAGRAWLSNQDDGVDKVTLFDAMGHATAQIVSTSNAQGANANPLGRLQSPAQLAGMAELRRTDTRYDLLGNVVDNNAAHSDGNDFLVRVDGKWTRVSQPNNTPMAAAQVVIGTAADKDKAITVSYRSTDGVTWIEAPSAAVQWLDGLPVFNTSALPNGSFEYRVYMQPAGEPSYQSGGGLLTVAIAPDLSTNALLIQLHVLILNSAPDAAVLNRLVGMYNGGYSSAQIALDLLDSAAGRAALAGGSLSFMTDVFQNVLFTRDDSPDIARWQAQFDYKDANTVDNRGQALVDLLAAKGSVLKSRSDALLNYLSKEGGSDPLVAQSVLLHAYPTPDAAIAEGSAAAKLERQKAQVVRLYLAILGRAPNPTGLDFWLNSLKNNATIDAVADAMLDSDEALGPLLFPKTGLSLDVYHNQLVRRAYANLLGRAPSAAEEADALAKLRPGQANYRGAFIGALCEQVAAYRGADTAKLAERRGVFDKVAIGLAYAAMPQDGVDLDTQVLVARSIIGASGNEVDPVAAANKAIQSLQQQGQANNTTLAAAKLAAGAMPLEEARQRVARLYVALLGRAPNREGLEFWSNSLLATPPNTPETIANEMLSHEARDNPSLYPPGLSDSDFVKRLYNVAFGSQEHAEALATWLPRLAAGATRGKAALAIIDGFLAGSSATELANRAAFNNKVAVGITYALNMGGNNMADAAKIVSLVSATDTAAALAFGMAASASLLKAANLAVRDAATNADLLNTSATVSQQASAATATAAAAAGSAAAANPMAAPLMRAALLYSAVLNRGNAGFDGLDLTGLSAMAANLQKGQSETEAVSFMLTSKEAVALYPPGDYKPEAFVKQLYRFVLERSPSPAELARWSALAATVDKRAAAAVQIVNSLLQDPIDDANPDKAPILQARVAFHRDLAATLAALATPAAQAVSNATQALAGATRADLAGKTGAASNATAALGAAVSAGAASNARQVLEVARLFVGILNRGAANPIKIDGLNFWTLTLLRGYPATTVADEMVKSIEGKAIFDGLSDADFVKQIFMNTLGRPPAEKQVFWTDALKTASRGTVAASIIGSLLNDTAPLASEYQSKANFDQRVSDALKPLLATAASEAAAVQKRLNDAKALSTTGAAAVTAKANAVIAAQNLNPADAPAVQAARAGRQVGLAFQASPDLVKQLTDILVAFKSPADFTTVSAKLADLVAGRNTLADIAGAAAGAGAPITSPAEKRAFVVALFNKVLQRPGVESGIAFWMAGMGNDPKALAKSFLDSALVELYTGDPLRVRNDFTGEVYAVAMPNQNQAQELIDGYDRALAAASASRSQQILQAAAELDVARAAIANTAAAISDLSATLPVAQAALTALNAGLKVQTAAVAADNATRDALLAADSVAAAAKLVNLAGNASIADFTAALAAANGVKAALALDAALAGKLADAANAGAGAAIQAQKTAGAAPATRQLALVAQMYTLLLARAPTLAETNQALAAFKAGSSVADQANALIAANPTLYPASLGNDAYVTKLFANGLGRAPAAASLRFWSDALAGAGAHSRGQLVDDLIGNIVKDNIGPDTATLNGKVGPALKALAAAALAAANAANVADFITANSAAARAAAQAADAAGAAALTPAARHATETAQLYTLLLGRAPDPAAMTAALALRAGGAAPGYIVQNILDSTEILGRFPAGLANQDFVARLFELGLGRKADAAELAAWTAKLKVPTYGRAQLAIDLVADIGAYAGADAGKVTARNLFVGRVSDALNGTVAAVAPFGQALDRSVTMLREMVAKPRLAQYVDGAAVALNKGATLVAAPYGAAKLTVDRWGNVLSVADARNPNWSIRYTYNHDNQLIDQTVNALKGAADVAHSSTDYDALGRVVVTTDFKGKANRVGYDANGNVALEVHADGGVVNYTYNLFGNRKSVKQPDTPDKAAYGALTSYAYDHLGHLTTVSTESSIPGKPIEIHEATFYDVHDNDKPVYSTVDRLTTTYAYDELGRNTSVTTANGAVSTTAYDLDGNVIRSVASYKPHGVRYTPAGGYLIPEDAQNVTLNRYDAFHHLVATLDGNGNTMTWQTDSFGRVSEHKDLGGATVSTRYNAAGQKISQSTVREQGGSTESVLIRYGYRDTLLTSIDQGATVVDDADGHHVGNNGMLTTYDYDLLGNRTLERQSYAAGYDNAPARVQNNVLSYDMQNRVLTVKDEQYTLTYSYDNNGNRLSVHTQTASKSDLGTVHNRYDAMNRQTIVNGDLLADGKTVVYGAHGHELTYDNAGKRLSDTFIGKTLSYVEVPYFGGRYSTGDGTQETTEIYSYDSAGRLATTRRDGVTIDQRHYDAAGRVSESGLLDYVQSTGKHQSTSDSLFSAATALGTETGSTTYHYDNNGRIQRQTIRGTGGDVTSDYYYVNDKEMGGHGYVGGYDAVGNLLGYTLFVPGRNEPDWGRYSISYSAFDSYKELSNRVDQGEVSTSTYDVNGNRTSVSMAGKVTGKYWYDAAGHVQSKIDYGKPGETKPPKASFSLIVNDQVLGYEDNDDTNILGSTYMSAHSPAQTAAPSAYTVQSGDETLQSIAQAVWGDSKLWYLIADANGINAGDKLGVGKVLNIPTRVNTVHNDYATFKPYDAAEAIGNTTPALPPPTHGSGGGCGGVGALIMIVVAVAATIVTGGAALAAGMGQMMAGAIAGAVGSVASQVVGMALGVQDGFNWKGVALGAMGGAIAGGIGASGIMSGEGGIASAGRAALTSIASQGVGIVTGLQPSFSWSSVAFSAVSAGIGAELKDVTTQFAGNFGDPNIAGSFAQAAQRFTSGFVSTALTSKLLGGKMSYVKIATDAFGNALGSSLADKLSNYSGRAARIAADQMRSGAEDATAYNDAWAGRNGAGISIAGGGTWADDDGAYPRGNQYRFLTGGPAAAGAADSPTTPPIETWPVIDSDGDVSPRRGGPNFPAGMVDGIPDKIWYTPSGGGVPMAAFALNGRNFTMPDGYADYSGFSIAPVSADGPALQDNLLGKVVGAVFETPVAIASSVVGGFVGSVVGAVNGFTNGKYGTPEGVREASELAGSVAQTIAYRPSTATGREFAQTIGQWANDSGIGGLGFSELNALRAATSSAMRVGQFLPSLTSRANVAIGYTGAGTTKLDAAAEAAYSRIRAQNLNDVSAVAKNIGLSTSEATALKKQLFFGRHEYPLDGTTVVRQRFAADHEIAFAWNSAVRGELSAPQQSWLQQLAGHELAERSFMAKGVPYLQQDAWNGMRFTGFPKGAHDMAPAPPKVNFPGYETPWNLLD